jgi:hypothetical protein
MKSKKKTPLFDILSQLRVGVETAKCQGCLAEAQQAVIKGHPDWTCKNGSLRLKCLQWARKEIDAMVQPTSCLVVLTYEDEQYGYTEELLVCPRHLRELADLVEARHDE